MASEGRVIVPPDSSGKSIRTAERSAMLGDGSVVTEETQVVMISNRDGSLVDFNRLITAIEVLHETMVELLEAIREIE